MQLDSSPSPKKARKSRAKKPKEEPKKPDTPRTPQTPSGPAAAVTQPLPASGMPPDYYAAQQQARVPPLGMHQVPPAHMQQVSQYCVISYLFSWFYLFLYHI